MKSRKDQKTRTVTPKGTIYLENRTLRVPPEWAGSRVTVFTNSLGGVEVNHAGRTVIPKFIK